MPCLGVPHLKHAGRLTKFRSLPYGILWLTGAGILRLKAVLQELLGHCQSRLRSLEKISKACVEDLGAAVKQ